MKEGIKTYSSMIKNKKKRSLQAVHTKIRRVSLCSPAKKKIRAVLTVEAALIMPLFLLAVCTLLGMLDIYRVQALVKTSLHQSAEELGMYAAMENGNYEGKAPVGIVSSGVCMAYAKKHLPDLGTYVSVSTLGSRYEHHRVRLKATVTYQLPFSLLPVTKIQVSNGSTVAAWTGYHPDKRDETGEGGEEMVYVSDYESVYHTSAQCTHLDLSIHQGERNQMEKLRNLYGKKYYVCEKCKGNSTLVYYTEKGDRYHSQISCSGLKRSLRLVEKSTVHAQNQCERCRESGR